MESCPSATLVGAEDIGVFYHLEPEERRIFFVKFDDDAHEGVKIPDHFVEVREGAHASHVVEFGSFGAELAPILLNLLLLSMFDLILGGFCMPRSMCGEG